ncbi:MAG: shikimate kinase [Solirubrobacteraceae bacterium]
MTSEELVLQRINARARATLLQKHIVLVGFMGAGKSTLGSLIAGRLGRVAFDSDEVVETRAGRSIVDFFQSGEEKKFRELEASVVRSLLRADPAVISLGGGTLDNEQLREMVFQRSFVVNLAVSWREVQTELPQLRQTRPMLGDRSEAEIHSLFLRRQHTYRRAHMRISMPRGDVSAAADQLLSVLTLDSF